MISLIIYFTQRYEWRTRTLITFVEAVKWDDIPNYLGSHNLSVTESYFSPAHLIPKPGLQTTNYTTPLNKYHTREDILITSSYFSY